MRRQLAAPGCNVMRDWSQAVEERTNSDLLSPRFEPNDVSDACDERQRLEGDVVVRTDHDRPAELTAEDRARLEAHRAGLPARPVAEVRADRAVELVAKADGRATTREIAEALGISRTSAAKAAARVVRAGRLISRSGNPKTAGYDLPESVTAGATQSARPRCA